MIDIDGAFQLLKDYPPTTKFKYGKELKYQVREELFKIIEFMSEESRNELDPSITAWYEICKTEKEKKEDWAHRRICRPIGEPLLLPLVRDYFLDPKDPRKACPDTRRKPFNSDNKHIQFIRCLLAFGVDREIGDICDIQLKGFGNCLSESSAAPVRSHFKRHAYLTLEDLVNRDFLTREQANNYLFESKNDLEFVAND